MRKKRLLAISICLLGMTLALLNFATGFITRSLLQKSLHDAKLSGLTLSFDQHIPPENSTLDLRNVIITFKTAAWTIKINKVGLSTNFNFAWPPLRIKTEIDQLNILRSDLHSPETDTNIIPNPLLRSKNIAYLLIFPLVQFNFAVKNLNIPELKINNADLQTSINGVYLLKNEISPVYLNYQLTIKKWDKIEPLLIMPLISKGTLVLIGPFLTLENSFIQFGPLSIKAAGKYGLLSDKWSLDLDAPEKHIDQALQSVPNEKQLKLESIKGTVYLKIAAQGLGFDLKTLNTDGEARLEDVILKLNSPKIKGTASINLKTKFKRSDEAHSSTQLNLNLDQMTIYGSNTFVKTEQTPTRFEFDVLGEGEEFQIKKGTGLISNLNLKFGGSILNGPKLTAKISGSFDSPDLSALEKLVPGLTSKTSQGSLNGRLAYEGGIEDWRTADFNIEIKAQNLQTPRLQKRPISMADISVKNFSGKPNLSILINAHNLGDSSPSGSFSSMGSCDLSKTPSFCEHSLRISELDTEIFNRILNLEKNTITGGKLTASAKLSHLGLRPKSLISTIQGSGDFKILNPQFSGAAISKTIVDRLSSFPQMKGQLKKQGLSGVLREAKGRLTFTSSALSILDAKVKSPSFEFSFPTLQINNFRELNGTGGWTPTPQLITQHGLNLLMNKKGRATIPLTIEGSLYSPKTSFNEEELVLRILERAIKIKSKVNKESASRAFKKLQNRFISGDKRALLQK